MEDVERIANLIALYRDGALADRSFHVELFQRLNAMNVAQIVSRLPPDILTDLATTAGAAPRTEAEWNQTFVLEGISETSLYDRSVSHHAALTAYRTGIETLRRHLNLE